MPLGRELAPQISPNAYPHFPTIHVVSLTPTGACLDVPHQQHIVRDAVGLCAALAVLDALSALPDASSDSGSCSARPRRHRCSSLTGMFRVPGPQETKEQRLLQILVTSVPLGSQSSLAPIEQHALHHSLGLRLRQKRGLIHALRRY